MGMTLTLRHKLIILYLLTVAVPLVVLIAILPSYYRDLFNRQTSELYEGTLSSLTSNVEMYLDELERLTIAPYLLNDVMVAMKLKADNRFDEASEYARHLAERSLRFTLPNQLRLVRKDILGTMLVLADGSVYPVNYTNQPVAPEPGYPYEQQEWYRKAVEQDGKVAYISSHPQDYFGSDRQVFSVARLLKDPDSGKPLGVILADADNIVLENIIRNVRFNVMTIVAVLDENNRPLYSSRPLNESMLAQLAAGAKTVEGPDDTYRAVVKTMDASGWSIAVLFSNREFQSQLAWIYRIGLLFAAGGILLTMLLNVSLTRWIVHPFTDMVRVMKKVQHGDLNHRFNIRGRDEIAQLGAALNIMISRLREMIDREYRAVLGRRNAEFRALQSQIHPHFLYNTLNGLIGLNRSGQHRLLEKAILSLSGMLRYTLEHADTSTLKHEMDFLAAYCELQKLRFGDRLEYRIEYHPDLAGFRLPKLLLQPLVENAVIHGIEPLDRPGRLLVRAERVKETDGAGASRVRIRIEDNGAGFDSAAFGEGVGIANVRERLMLFNRGAALKLHSAPGEGTTAELSIPAGEVTSG
jgi:two-component system sensor histidine kinase YesM